MPAELPTAWQFAAKNEEIETMQLEKDDLVAKVTSTKRELEKVKRERDEIDLELDELRSSANSSAGGPSQC